MPSLGCFRRGAMVAIHSDVDALVRGEEAKRGRGEERALVTISFTFTFIFTFTFSVCGGMYVLEY